MRWLLRQHPLLMCDESHSLLVHVQSCVYGRPTVKASVCEKPPRLASASTQPAPCFPPPAAAPTTPRQYPQLHPYTMVDPDLNTNCNPHAYLLISYSLTGRRYAYSMHTGVNILQRYPNSCLSSPQLAPDLYCCAVCGRCCTCHYVFPPD